MQQAINLIKKSNNILILTHKNPDGDAVGSVLGLAEALKFLGKDTECFSKDKIPNVFNFLPGVSNIKNQISPKHYDLVVLLDCALFDRTGLADIKEAASSFDKLLIIDHHPKSKTECDCSYIIDSKASSTAILIYALLKEMKIRITKNISDCLLTGIFTDTGGFQHSNTDPRSLETAAELMRKGSRVDKIAKNIFNGKNVPAIKLWGKALSRIQTDKNTGMAVSYISKNDIEECGAKEEDASGLVNIINTVSDAKFSLLLTEGENKKIKGSLRSEDYYDIDVSEIARSLGGGGHKLASGFEMEGENVKNSVEKIREMILETNKKLI
jgi:phosphoesterase RecJ-like protein